jgi:hypothetical protein
MRNHTQISGDNVAVWKRVIEFQGRLNPSAARALLRFGFSERDHDVMSRLSAKASIGTLTPNEQTELDTFERLGCLLDIVHSKARQALKLLDKNE